MLRECGLAHKTIVFVLDEFDLFAQVRFHHPALISTFFNFQTPSFGVHFYNGSDLNSMISLVKYWDSRVHRVEILLVKEKFSNYTRYVLYTIGHFRGNKGYFIVC